MGTPANALDITASGFVKFDGVNVFTGVTKIPVASGGTDSTSFTAYSLIAAGTTSTGAMQSVGAGSSGQIIRSGGASALPSWSTATYPATAGTSGKVLISDGSNIVSSTPTFPNASATSGKIIKSDGTNWVASTETYAAPGTSGNVLTSDGTNWTSAAPTSSSGYAIYYSGGNNVVALNDSTTYYAAVATSWTTSHPRAYTRMYIPTTGTITKAYGAFYTSSTLGSSENTSLYIRLNDTTDTAISTTINLSSADVSFSNTSLGISVTAGDYIEIKLVTPAWVTNPVNTSFCVTIFVT